MTPFGHVSVSVIASSKIYSISLRYVVIGGLIPDIDVISYFFNSLNTFHRTYTHSVGFLIFCLIIIYVVNKKDKKIKNILLSFGFGFMLHIIVDAGLDNNYSNGIGIPMLWPFYDGYIYWFSYFINVSSNNLVSWKEPLKFLSSNIINILLLEIPFYIYAIILYNKKEGK